MTLPLWSVDDDYDEHFRKIGLYIRSEPQAATHAVDALTSGQPDLQAAGLDVLSEAVLLLPRHAPERAILINACQRLRAASSADVRWSVAHALGRQGSHLSDDSDEEVADLLADMAGDSESRVRWQVAAGLVGVVVGPTSADNILRALLALVRDSDAEVRSWATFALAGHVRLDSPAVRTALLHAVKDDDPEVAGEAVVGLARRGDSRGRPYLHEMLNHQDVSNTPLEAVVAYGGEEWLPQLRALERSGWKERDDMPQALDEAIAASLSRPG